MKYVKSLIALALAALLGGEVQASLSVTNAYNYANVITRSDEGGLGYKDYIADVTMKVGETVVLRLHNDTDVGADPRTYTPTASGDQPTLWTATLNPTTIDAGGDCDLTIEALAETEEKKVLYYKDSAMSGTPVEINITITAKDDQYVEFMGQKIYYSNAKTDLETVPGELLLTFTNTAAAGTFNLPVEFDARVLIVGGGAGGLGSYGKNSPSNGYGSNGGNGGSVVEKTLADEFVLSSGDYTVTVGKGGNSVAGTTSSSGTGGGYWNVNNPGAKSSLVSGEDSLEAAGGTAFSGLAQTTKIENKLDEGGTQQDDQGAICVRYATSLYYSHDGKGAGAGESEKWVKTGATSDISGAEVAYGVGGAGGATGDGTEWVKIEGTAGAPANSGNGGAGGSNGGSGGAGADGIVIVRLFKAELTEIAVPVSQGGFTYDGHSKTGVVEGTGYTLSGTWFATDANAKAGKDKYVATATLQGGYCWEGGSTEATNISWTIARAPVTVSAVDYAKVYGTADPEPLPATIVGTNGFDGAVITYDISREVGETVNTYEITISDAPAEQGNYQVSVVDPTKATFTINYADLYPLVLDGGAITVKVTRVWIERQFFDQKVMEPVVLSETLKQLCNSADAFTMWQKYLININTNNGFIVEAPENFDPETVSILPAGEKNRGMAEPVAEEISGVKVQFRLEKEGEPITGLQDDTTFKVSLAGNPNSSNYLVRVFFTQNGRSYDQPCRNYIGILKSEPYTTSGGAREFVAIPWNKYDGRSNGLAVTNIVKAALLSEGDKLYYRPYNDRFEYDAWQLGADKKWQPINAIGIGPNGCWSNRVNKTGNDKLIPYGGALWLDRKDATTGVVFAGGGRSTGKPQTVNKKQVYACSPLGITGLDVKTLKYGNGARIIIPTPGAPIIWTYDGENWSSKEQYVDESGIVRTRDRVDSVIKPGRGYWLDRTADESL